ncbi:(+)-neomenthol dehydrogenase-like isoform X1 [Impatiens glandulifera]|uniref:(+)-neomenthol dehydrogenase-like isoform X1 n=1 Tax=Impatiens glandulifera TaxID=253017 RepID=UPI001FB0EC39|nr:(+)-neomenthol dehydrogenase-like isoform X1 [Impatiens glandulifera]
MAETKTAVDQQSRIAVVTGGNGGIGFEICKQLAMEGLTVILTSRDQQKGIEAVKNINKNNIRFYQLDVTDPHSIASLANYITTQFGKLDILVNNSGVLGTTIDTDLLERLGFKAGDASYENAMLLLKSMKQTYDNAKVCVETNYYGVKHVTKALIPLLRLSAKPTIVNVSSVTGKLENVTNERARAVLSEVDDLTEEKIDEIVEEFLKDAEEDKIESKGWPNNLSAYTVSKAAQNGYARVLARDVPDLIINSVCPGYTQTGLNGHQGEHSAEVGAKGPVMLALNPPSGCSGFFFNQTQISEF